MTETRHHILAAKGNSKKAFQLEVHTPLPLMETDDGIRVVGTPLWLDATRPKDLCFLSRPAYQMAVRHRRVLCTDTCSMLIGRRQGPKVILEMGYHQPIRFGQLEVTLLPAGFGPGSAQAHIKSSAGTLLYTGPFNLDPPPLTEPFVPGSAQILALNLPRLCSKTAAQKNEDVIQAIMPVLRDLLASENHAVLLAERWRLIELGALLENTQSPLSWALHGGIRRVMRRLGAAHIPNLPPTPGKSSPSLGGMVLLWPLDSIGSLSFQRWCSGGVAKSVIVSGSSQNETIKSKKKRCDPAAPVVARVCMDDGPSPDTLRGYVSHAAPQMVLLAGAGAAEAREALQDQIIPVRILQRPSQLNLL